jgi:hypothetical protein
LSTILVGYSNFYAFLTSYFLLLPYLRANSHLKQTGAILLLVLMLAQTFSKCWMVVSFVLNQRTIATTLCENRSNPNSSCHGKCYLRKQLANEERQENAALGNSAKEKFEVLLPDDKNVIAAAAFIVDNPFPAYTAATITQESAAIFHPPRA